MTAPNFTDAVEAQIRNFISGKVLAVLPLENVFVTPTIFASPQDFAAMVGDSATFAPRTYKVRYLMLYFESFVDSANKGCDDNPSVFVNYRMQLFKQFQEARDLQPNSHDLLVKDMIALRNSFLRDREIDLNHITHGALVQQGGMSIASVSEYVLNVIGDWLNFRLTVEIN